LSAKKKQKNGITKYFPVFIQKKLQIEIKRELSITKYIPCKMK